MSREPTAAAERSVRVALGGFGDTMDRGLTGLLDGTEGVEVVRSRLPPAELEATMARGDADVAVLGEIYARSPALIERLRAARPGVGIVVMADDIRPGVRMRLLTVGCLPTDARESELAEAVRRAADGDSMHLLRAHDGAGLNAIDRLTPREWDVLVRKERGQGNAQIARALNVTVNTVRSHVSHIYDKLGVKSAGELFALKLAEGRRE